VQQGALAAPDRADDVPAFLQKLGGHGMAEAAFPVVHGLEL